jgi:hypothetical protein
MLLDLARTMMPGARMNPDTRAMIAAAVFAFVSGKRVAGMHDHASGKDRRIAAESRGKQVQGYDGDRSAGFGGQLPDLYDSAAHSFVSLDLDGAKAQGFDHASATAYTAQVSDQRVQVFDHGEGAWFTFDMLVAGPG